MASQETVLFVWEGLDRNGSRTKGEVSARSEITARAERMQEEDAGDCWLPALLGDDFMGAVLHFRGMFRE